MISTIIPTLNEEENLPALLAALKSDPVESEVIVVDGGSHDRTREIAESFGALVLKSSPGRGLQLKIGAHAARGDVLWFLHADSRIDATALKSINTIMTEHPASPGGNFRLLFDGQDSFSIWLNDFYAWIRAKGIYYGDSGVFVRRSAYGALGGIKPLALMEDYEFNRRLERYGSTVQVTSPALRTSSRRFKDRKKWHIISQWIYLHLLYHLRFPADWLANFYNSKRKPS